MSQTKTLSMNDSIKREYASSDDLTQDQSNVVKIGRYQHYKGNLYEVLGEATHSESLEVMIVYRALYGDFGLWVRPKKMFLEHIILNDQKVPRFRYANEDELP